MYIEYEGTSFEIRISKMNYNGYEETSLVIYDTWNARIIHEDEEFELPKGDLTVYLEDLISELS